VDEREAYEQYAEALRQQEKQYEILKEKIVRSGSLVNLATAVYFEVEFKAYEAARKKEAEALEQWLQVLDKD